MEIQARPILGMKVPSSGKDLFELRVGKFSSLLEAVHGPSDFNVDETIGGNVGGKVVVLNDLRRCMLKMSMSIHLAFGVESTLLR